MADLNGSGAPVDTTQIAGSALDATASGSPNSGFDWLGQGLSKLLDTYAAVDANHVARSQGAVEPAGYYRMPGTNTVAAAGVGVAGMSPVMLLVLGVVVLGVVIIAVKK